MTVQPRVARGGVTLRHWTTDDVSFVGGREGPSPGLAMRDLADGRLLNLVASRLRLIKAQPSQTTA
jgi:hypothetical protein